VSSAEGRFNDLQRLGLRLPALSSAATTCTRPVSRY